MSTQNNGGPAFPMHPDAVPAFATQFTGIGYTHGMSLRDWFAGQALPAVVSALAHSNGSIPEAVLTDLFGPTATNIRKEEIAAALAYTLAEAMLARRNQST